jgi:hypothetical protein
MTSRLLAPRRRERREEAITAYPIIDQSQLSLKLMPRERRMSKRFPIELRAELQVGQTCIHGTTVNISSGGLLLTCSPGELKTRRRVMVRLPNWPSSPEGGEISLIVMGSIVRIGPRSVAVRRTKYEFHAGIAASER